MSKHRRATNFSKSEQTKLIELVLEKKYIIQNKKTDSVTSKLKDEAWDDLATQFNAWSSDEIRTPKVLREKYNNIKRWLRKKKADKRKEFIINGGISSTKEWNENNSLFDELSDVISVSADGFPFGPDSDALLYKQNGDQTELKEEMIDYYDDEEEAEPSGDCDNNCAVFADIDMRINEGGRTSQAEVSNIIVLKKQILEQQFHQTRLEHEQKMKHDRLEHEQKILHAAEEHKIKIKILEAELKLKKSKLK